MAGEFLLTLKETPSFEGELSVRLMEEHDSEGRANYSLVCEKKPPLDREEWPLIVGVRSGVFGDHLGLKEITKRDRKSTRLNSSHRCISYAVFCLKKKRKTHAAMSRLVRM